MDIVKVKIGLDSALEKINYTKLRLKFRAIEEIHTSEYKGSAFRGCFGESFRRVVCRYPGAKCEKCQLLHNCKFGKLYAAHLNRNHPLFGFYTHPPRPYIIIPMESRERIFRHGDIFFFDLVLIGSSANLYSIIPDVVKSMVETGIGTGHSKFEAISIEYYSPNDLWYPLPALGLPDTISICKVVQKPINKRVTLKFETPVRFLKEKRPHKEVPSFDLLIDRLAMRVSLLSHLYCSSEWVNTACSFNLGDSVKIKSEDLDWRNWARYSGTKGKVQFYDGHIGEITYEGDLKPWSKLLNIGSILHTGSTATFGLGRYSIINYE
ncbi:MAG: CRISPR system precrRNA processing endoribonuclease RAMP protein Cas6 [Bacteroidales bacterium]|nr:CRISPR system precrRNA processing endoribonuclease RAMP protein Cas6 [Bacteroidales bacterium]